MCGCAEVKQTNRSGVLKKQPQRKPPFSENAALSLMFHNVTGVVHVRDVLTAALVCMNVFHTHDEKFIMSNGESTQKYTCTAVLQLLNKSNMAILNVLQFTTFLEIHQQLESLNTILINLIALNGKMLSRGNNSNVKHEIPSRFL